MRCTSPLIKSIVDRWYMLSNKEINEDVAACFASYVWNRVSSPFVTHIHTIRAQFPSTRFRLLDSYPFQHSVTI